MAQRTEYSRLDFPFYPFLIAIAPVVSLYAVNSTTLGVLDLIRPTLVYLVVAALAVFTSWITNKNSRTAALLAIILLAGFLSYGAIARIVYSNLGQGFVTSFLHVFWSGFILGVFIIAANLIRRFSFDLRKTTVVFNVFAIVMVFAATIQLFMAPKISGLENNQQLVNGRTYDHEWLSHDARPDRRDLPDFYYLILDAYARADVLETRFDYDNTDTIRWLEDQGFFVGEKSHANYPWTHLSLSSTLNAEYLQMLVPTGMRLNANGTHTDRFIFVKKYFEDNFINEDNKALQFFRNLGYTLRANNTGESLTRRRPETIREALASPLYEFEERLLSRSLAQPLISNLQNIRAFKKSGLIGADKILGMLDDFADSAQYEGPKFVFSHIISPHTPFTFDTKGNSIPMNPVFDSSPWLSDRVKIPGYNEWYRENYSKNVAGLNIHLKRTLEALLISTGGNAVIIIQSDHGPFPELHQQTIDFPDVEVRFGILNAIYIPKRFSREGLIDSMSAVNTFPIILNNVFGLNIPVKEDRAYFSSGDLNFHEVTDKVRGN